MSEPEITTADPVVATCSQKRCIWPWIISAILLVLLALSLAPWFVPRLAWRTPMGHQLQAVLTQISLQQSQAVQQQPQVMVMPPSMPPVITGPDIARLHDLESQLQALAAAQQATDNAARQAASQAGSAAAISATRPLLLAGTIEARLANGLAYTNELNALAPSLNEADRTALAALASGSDTPAQLAQSLDQQQRRLASTYRESMATGWWDKIRARLSRLILIRLPGSTSDTVLNDLDRLSAQIAHDDMGAALTALDALPPLVRDGLSDLRGKLNARKAAQDTLRQVATQLGSDAETPAPKVAPAPAPEPAADAAPAELQS